MCAKRLSPVLFAIETIVLLAYFGNGIAAYAFNPTPIVTIQCRPPLVYRGDDLVIKFGGSPHNDFDFGVLVAAPPTKHSEQLFLLSFKPGKNDRIAPVIPPEEFKSMWQITLNTATVRASLSNLWQGDEVPRALKPPELIFTGSGSYEFLLSPGIGGEVSTFGACWVTYVDEERRPGAVLQMDASFTATENTFHQDSCSARTWNDAVMCPATTIYQGDELALYLASRYPARRIGIVDPDWNIYLLPAEKDPETGMPGIRIVAGSEAAQSYSYESAPDLLGRSVHVETKAGRVFTKSGWYIAVSVPGPQCDTTTDVGACWIHYVDRPHPR